MSSVGGPSGTPNLNQYYGQESQSGSGVQGKTEQGLCHALQELESYLDQPSYTYKMLYKHLDFLIKYCQAILSQGSDGGAAEIRAFASFLRKGSWKKSAQSNNAMIATDDRTYLHEVFQQTLANVGCNDDSKAPVPFFPPLKETSLIPLVAVGSVVVAVIAFGAVFGRGILDNVFSDNSGSQPVQPNSPSGGDRDVECGNGVREGNEACDGSDLGVCDGGCRANCTCLGAVCGNDIIEAGESCDGTQLGPCTVGCTAACLCDLPSVCGNNVLEEGEECDGVSMGACRGTCSDGCFCLPDDTSSGSDGGPQIWCGDGACNGTETADSCPDDCGNRSGSLCAENGGVQWQGEVCVCSGFVDQVTICNDGTKTDNVTNIACTPDPSACQSQSGGGNGGSGGNNGAVCGNGIVEDGEACEGTGICGVDAYCIECACIPLPK